MTELYPQHIKDFIIANNQNKSLIEITDLINSNFNTNYTYTQIKRLRAKLKIISGITGRFEKGHIPHNLGKKGFCPPEFYAQQFSKGHIPHNKAEIGEERITTDGYVVVKIAQPNIWRRKHILEWEKTPRKNSFRKHNSFFRWRPNKLQHRKSRNCFKTNPSNPEQKPT